ncbi:Golgi-specific brefeldin A-resistance guanine nucleotide exchange factor 1 isoform X2 [Neocloeon triangulifer]|uniref:Golgi-specific brefeldin A-resistance guanine nucleotide exchange factor 1 isoform X2 n=1 Tax=Neocloeon triangulifer TaxID=2078957 RepID=UPI00286ED034|nr:Golgi-specific brefeldin A-resistance guanine nucleotide exchange factor 1 isoform X2 [Neocloeon triangulifer]
MPLPGNGIYVVQGEISTLLTAMRRGVRWSSHSYVDEEQDALMRSFTDLKDVLNQIGDLRDLDPNHFLGPFLEVIRSEETTGPVTSLALSAINKFLSYGLVDPKGRSSIPATVENIADAVTHARFVGTDQASDGVVLMKILQVLRTLILHPGGVALTNESVCEIMLSCFRICFETRLSELLRKSAEHSLKDIVQLLFSRLPEFADDHRMSGKKLKMRASSIDASNRKHKKSKAGLRPKSKSVDNKESASTSGTDSSHNDKINDVVKTPEPMTESPQPGGSLAAPKQEHLSTTPMTPAGNIVDMQGAIHQSPTIPEEEITPERAVSADSGPESVVAETSQEEQAIESEDKPELTVPSTDIDCGPCVVITMEDAMDEEAAPKKEDENQTEQENLVAEAQSPTVEEKGYQAELLQSEGETETVELGESRVDTKGGDSEPKGTAVEDYVNEQGVVFMAQDIGAEAPLIPYGVACVRELFRFLVSLCNPLDKQNSEVMIHIGLTLLTVAFEIGADHIGRYNSLLSLIRDDLCRNLFSLLSSERLSIFATNLQVSFLMFESMRTHLKFQLELYLNRLMDIIVSDSPKTLYEQKEMALESVVQLWRIPGLVTELYLNYDCDLYSPNLFEDLTKLLSKNAFPVAGLYNTHLLSLDALLTIIDAIECHCHNRILNQRQEVKGGDIESPQTDESIKALVEQSPAFAFRNGRQKVSKTIPSHEQLMAIKCKKKLLANGTEQFNSKATKGISFLQENHLLSTPLDENEVVIFLKENPKLHKKMIGEYISNRKNLKVLEAFVKSFDFVELRIDEALRLYLETFRLPGEAPLISLVLEHFADHWHKCNNEPFANADAAFTLAYAVIMLNVDQHNYNVKKQSIPMTIDQFKRNLKGVNGNQDFDEEMLDDIYESIKKEEIVMPAEQTGLVRENYLWKVLLRRGASKEGVYVHAPNGLFDHDLFSLIWGPTVAALSFVFDKSNDATIYQKSISGFRKCAMISAHYGMSNDFDNLIISLCKFTTLLNSTETPDNLTISFGSNTKAMLAAKTVFNLAHRHGDILREGWKNVLDCLLQLYRCKLLPKALVEAEDFIDQSGKISLIREELPSQKTETGLFSSLYSYLSSEPTNYKGPSPEDQEYIKQAQHCVRDCHLEHLVTESKFLRLDSLQEMVKAFIIACHGPDGHVTLESSFDEDAAVFFLEMLIKIVIQNRDRVSTIWPAIRDHIYSLIMGATACDHHFLMERSIVGLLRLAIRLMRREDMSPVVLQSLRMLLLLKSQTLYRVSRQISFGLYELLKTSASNIHSETDWAIIFNLLECVGAGGHPPKVVGDSSQPSSDQGGAKSDGEIHPTSTAETSGIGSERGYTSDSELQYGENLKSKALHPRPLSPGEPAPSGCSSPGGWILVGREGEIQPLQVKPFPVNQCSIVHERELLAHDTHALVKCVESLAFLVRDVAHITPYNFENCVRCIRTFVEASIFSNDKKVSGKPGAARDTKSKKRSITKKRVESQRSRERALNPYDADESDPEDVPSSYQQVSIQLLDLMHTLHIRTAQIYKWWSAEHGDISCNSLWSIGWCPLLQGIARLCCDSRKQVRTSAITYLQRALLVHDLQTLTPAEWESCFNKVLFPLLAKLLEPVGNESDDPAGLEETRMRGATVLSKVFLHHLTPLQSLPTFTALWLTILDFMDKYMHSDKSDLLSEAITELLKNMLLVMDSAKVFSSADGYSQLWTITWDKISTFLPHLREDLFKSHPSVEEHHRSPDQVPSPTRQSPLPGETSPPPSSPPPQSAMPMARPSSIILQPPMQTVATPIFSPTTQYVPVNLPVASSPIQPVLNAPNNVTVSTPSVGLLLDPNLMKGTSLPALQIVSSPGPQKEGN